MRILKQFSKNVFRIFILFFLVLTLNFEDSFAAPPPPASGTGGTLLFKSGFEPNTIISAPYIVGGTDQGQKILGTDSSSGYTWPFTPGSRFGYNVAPASKLSDYIETRIDQVIGPQGSLTYSLYQEVKGDDPTRTGATTRNSYAIKNDGSGSLPEQGYARFWVKLQPDLFTVMQDSNAWWTPLEWWSLSDYRTYVSLNQYVDDVTGKPGLYWAAQGDFRDPNANAWIKDWKLTDYNVPVPAGKWALFEMFWKRDSVNGRFWFAIDGQTVFNHTGRTKDVQPINDFFAFKVYVGTVVLSRGPAYFWIDDFELWTDFPPPPPLQPPTQPPTQPPPPTAPPPATPPPQPICGNSICEIEEKITCPKDCEEIKEKDKFYEEKKKLEDAKKRKDEEAIIIHSKNYLFNVTTVLIGHLDKIKVMTKEADISNKLKEDIITDINKQIDDLIKIRKEIEAAKTKVGIRETAKLLRSKWKEVKPISGLYSQRILAARVEGIINRAVVLDEKLNRILKEAEEKGVKIELSSEIKLFSEKVELSKLKYQQAQDTLGKAFELRATSETERMNSLLKEANLLLNQSRNELKGAHNILKRISKKEKAV